MNLNFFSFLKKEKPYSEVLAELRISKMPDFKIQYHVENIVSQDIEKMLAEKISNFVDTQNKFTKDGEEHLKKIGQLTVNQLNQRLMLDNMKDKQQKHLKKLRDQVSEMTPEERTEDYKKSITQSKTRGFKGVNRRKRYVKKCKMKIKSLEDDIKKLEKEQRIADKHLGDQTRIKSILSYSVSYGVIMLAITLAETFVITRSLSDSDLAGKDGISITALITFVLTLAQAVFGHFSGVQSIKIGKFAPEFKMTFGAGIVFSLIIVALRSQSGSPIIISIFSLFAFLLEVYLSRQRYLNQNFARKITRNKMKIVALENRILRYEDEADIDKLAHDKTVQFERITKDQESTLEERINSIDRVKQQIKDAVAIEVFKGTSQLKSK